MTMKIIKYFLVLVSFKFQLVVMYKFEKPVAASIWTQPCSRNDRILNDCNWCRCTDQSRYACHARVCRDVDMFGHFTDAIRDINVGMEGRGSWRSGQTACEPGVYYQREDLLCVCNEDGAWPTPLCRETFRVLHSVQVVTDAKTFKDQQCSPGKLYLIGCNVCFCPADGLPNPKFCTRETCSKDDPVFDTPKHDDTPDVKEWHVQCDTNAKYKLGCKNCICLRNNRLVCDNCTDTNAETICTNKKPGEMFNIDCNICQCDEKGSTYCTVKRCLKNYVRSRESIVQSDFNVVDVPLNDMNCVPGTMYKKDCNTCYCFKRFGVKKFGCVLEKCSKGSTPSDCVEGSMYARDCLICQCGNYNGKKMEVCQKDPKCRKPKQLELMQITDLSGYCEPLHLYRKDCNTCECLPDGKTARCTTQICKKKNVEDDIIPKSIPVDIIPVIKDIGPCVRGSTFKINCNMCYCLMNGDVICTAEDCR